MKREKVYTEMKEEQTISEVTETTNSKPAGKFGKKHLGLIGAALVIIIALLIVIGINSPTRYLARQLELGQKYLEEMNYEEAVVVFNSVIEIDPMNVDAYLGLVEVYIRIGDFDTALAYAEKGYELMEDERLKGKIDMIESGNITASNGWTMKTSYYDYEYGTGLVGYVTWTRNLQGGIASVSVYDKTGNLIDTGEYQYDGNGNVVVEYGDFLYSETLDGRLTDIGVGLVRVKYEYDEEGRRIAQKTYDSSGNLTREWKYEYDASGNLISEEKNE